MVLGLRIFRYALSIGLPLALVAYTACLLIREAQTSQSAVRPYFNDIGFTFRFLSVNTTLSSTFMFGAALLLLFTATQAERAPVRQRLLLGVQGAFCLWSALDDRFRLHETIGNRLEINNGYVIAAVVVLNIAFYVALFRPWFFTLSMAVTLVASAAFTAVMLFLDTSVPGDRFLRLSIEDLSKTWGSYMLLIFAWEATKFAAVQGSPRSRALVVPQAAFHLVPRAWRGSEKDTLDRGSGEKALSSGGSPRAGLES